MGKKPLAGWIGVLGLGIVLTGCDCCRQSRQTQFAGGKAEGSMGMTNKASDSWNHKTQSSLANNSTSYPYVPTSGAATGRVGDPYGGSGSSGAGGASMGMGGNMPPSTGSGITPTSYNTGSSASGMGMNMSSASTNPPGIPAGASYVGSSGPSSSGMNMPGSSGGMSASGLKPTGSRPTSTTGVTDNYQSPSSMDTTSHSSMGSSDTTGLSVPPPPVPVSAGSSGSIGGSSTIAPYPPTKSGASSSSGDLSPIPPPASSGSSVPTTSLSGSGVSATPPVPPYMK